MNLNQDHNRTMTTTPQAALLTKGELRKVLQRTAESIDSCNIVMTHWELVARAVEQAVIAKPLSVDEPQYRLLRSDVDQIEASDEFLSEDTKTWAIDPNGIFVGMVYGGRVLRPARRRINGIGLEVKHG